MLQIRNIEKHKILGIKNLFDDEAGQENEIWDEYTKSVNRFCRAKGLRCVDDERYYYIFFIITYYYMYNSWLPLLSFSSSSSVSRKKREIVDIFSHLVDLNPTSCSL